MGRSRAVANSADDDPTQRSKRRRAPSSGENVENVSSGSGTGDGKKPLYHCNYCNKDITGKIRIKCSKCPDFDLCVECFSVGAEITPHKSNHPYRVMDNLSFPLICPDWFADEEILLLEAIEMYGLGNWTEVAEHVGTKTKDQCIEHYTIIYLNSPCFPLPDMSHVVGKNRKELLAMAKGQSDGKKGFLVGDSASKDESPFSPLRVKTEDGSRDVPVGRSPSSSFADGDSAESKMGGAVTTANASSIGATKKASNVAHIKDVSDRIKVEDTQANRSLGVKKPKDTAKEGPSLVELSGYNPKRQEFDPEYDNDAEQLLADMDFKENDPETERELKLRVLHIYSSRLDERKRRKEFILERNLLYLNPIEKDLSEEEREIYNRFKVFMRFHTQEEHDAMIKSLIEEHRLRKRIQELQECRAAGWRTMSEADKYLQQKRREAELNAQKAKEGSQVTGGGKGLQKLNRTIKGESDASPCSTGDNNRVKGVGSETNGKDSSSTIKSIDEWDILRLPGADLLNDTEQRFCRENRLLPSHYLKMQEVLVAEILKGCILQKSDAHSLFKVDPRKIDKIFDIVSKKLDLHSEQQLT